MNRLLLIISIALIAGCSSIPIPSIDYCNEVLYHRLQDNIDIQLKCQTNPIP